jgi:hypothetical protein
MTSNMTTEDYLAGDEQDPPKALYEMGEIVVIKVNGMDRKRHIYAEPYWEKVVGDYYTWKYPVDYKLGFTSEGIITEGQVIRRPIEGLPSDGGDDYIVFE